MARARRSYGYLPTFSHEPIDRGCPDFDLNTSASYAWCERFARAHYENFPVGSILIPRSLRPDFYAIYAWSRTADDLADEGDLSAAERIDALNSLEADLGDALSGGVDTDRPFIPALVETIRRRSIPTDLLLDLLVAFRRDAANDGFATTDELLGYCRYSANPVGRLVLSLFGLLDRERGARSDDICTGLQLANFWQDLSTDLPRGRVNIPVDVLNAYGLSIAQLIDEHDVHDARVDMLNELVELGRSYLNRGTELLRMIPVRRLRWELAAVVAGGLAILREVERLGSGVFHARPVVRTWRIAMGMPARLLRSGRSSLV